MEQHAAPAHAEYPTLHETPQLPELQIAVPLFGALQTVPHAPQLAGLVLRLTHEDPHFV